MFHSTYVATPCTIEQREFEITDEPHYSPRLRRQPTTAFNLEHNADLATDFVEPHLHPELNN
jgi:hypothetical protein